MSQNQDIASHSALPANNVLVIQPDERAPLARFSEWLAHHRAEITLLQPFRGDAIPSEITADGLVVLGGTMSWYDVDDFQWLEDITALYHKAVETNIPTLGICLGAQLLAVAFDGKVTVNSPTGPEIGVVDIEWTKEGSSDPLVGDLSQSFRATAFHYDGISALPEGAVLLGRGERYPNQVFRVGNAVGMQFHPETSPALFKTWCASDAAKKPELADSFADKIRQVEETDAEISSKAHKLAKNFVYQLHPAPQAQHR